MSERVGIYACDERHMLRYVLLYFGEEIQKGMFCTDNDCYIYIHSDERGRNMNACIYYKCTQNIHVIYIYECVHVCFVSQPEKLDVQFYFSSPATNRDKRRTLSRKHTHSLTTHSHTRTLTHAHSLTHPPTHSNTR